MIIWVAEYQAPDGGYFIAAFNSEELAFSWLREQREEQLKAAQRMNAFDPHDPPRWGCTEIEKWRKGWRFVGDSMFDYWTIYPTELIVSLDEISGLIQ